MTATFRRLSLDELRSEFGSHPALGSLTFNTPPSIVWDRNDEVTGSCVGFSAVVFDGPTTLPELSYVDSNSITGFDCNCILVNGDLTVQGMLDLTMSDLGLPAYIFVLGDLTADSVFIREQSELTVTGSMTVKTVLSASRWANGRLYIGGDLTARHAYIHRFNCKLGGRLINPVLLGGDPDYFETPASNRDKLWKLADWYVLDFDRINDVEDDDPLFQKHVVFNDYMFQDIPYSQSEEDKLYYWTQKGVDVFAELSWKLPRSEQTIKRDE